MSLYMTPFLQQLARIFYQTYKEEVSNFCFVFPNRRSGLFFEKYLIEEAKMTFFSPQITTTTDFFSQLSQSQIEDKMGLLFRLYTIYTTISKQNESFDSFVSFGEILLRDFDDIDKYMVDAKDLFQNVKDIQHINYISDYLTEEQKAIIQRFWTNFNPEPKRQQDFLATWEILHPLYTAFKEDLNTNKLAYEGMMLRELTEKGIEVEYQKVVFIGFNALSLVEKKLFLQLKKQQKADFYWDYEAEFVQDNTNKASIYMAENVTLFPSELQINPQETPEKYVEAIAVPSSVGQAKHVHQILEQLGADTVGTETAVVLSNENILLPMLYSLPDAVGKVNITMGYPLLFTPIKELIDSLLQLQKSATTNGKGATFFYYKMVVSLLSHRYIYTDEKSDEYKQLISKINQNNWIRVSSTALQTDTLLSLIFSPTDTDSLCGYLLAIIRHLLALKKENTEQDTTNTTLLMEQEFLYQCYTSLQRMDDLLHTWKIPLNLDTLSKLIKRILTGIAIPFEGEPLSGLQIMGMLETRCLDFENLIITSFNEGTFPKNETTPSFVPYNLRRGFGLPTTEHQDAIFAYHFYRLFHRASKVYLLYDTRTDMLNSGEKSRYITQLLLGYGIPIVQKTVTYNTSIAQTKAITIEKTHSVLEKLNAYTTDSDTEIPTRALSASSINTYINCPLQFYFSHIEKINPTDSVSESVEANIFGSIFHYVMEQLFAPYVNKMISKEVLQGLAKNKDTIDSLIQRGFAKYYFKQETIFALQGNNYLVSQVIKKYIIQLLHIEETNIPFLHIQHEYKCEGLFFISNIKRFARIKGSIDRVQTKEGKVMLTDYKTGTGKVKYTSIPALFDGNIKQRQKDILQIFLYGWLYQQATKTPADIDGQIIYIRELFKSNNLNQLSPESNYQKVQDEYLVHLEQCLETIFDPSIPFTQTTCLDNCTYCSFKQICR